MLDQGLHLRRGAAVEPVVRPAMGSIVLHGLLFCTVVFYALIGGLFHHNTWGGTQGGGAIQVQITSALPLPAEKVNDNVLATEKPSEAPAAPAPKQQQQVDTTAIPIVGKQTKPAVKNIPKTQQHQPPPKPDNKAQYGERSGTQMARSVQSSGSGPTQVSEGDFGSRFPWYVDGINRKMGTMWNKVEVDSSTPRGARVFLVFTVRHDGSPSEVQIDRSSGSGSLDRSCVRAAQRVDTFGVLPAGYNQSTLKVSYYCEY